MLAQSVAQQYHMAGVHTEETKAEFEGLSQIYTMRLFEQVVFNKFCLICPVQ